MGLGRTFGLVKAGAAVVASVVIGGLLSGCAAGGYNAGSLEHRLEKAGLSSRQATCVLDRMVARFGETELNARTEPIVEEIRAERTLLRRCGVRPTSPR
jgi:hypothetical protein